MYLKTIVITSLLILFYFSAKTQKEMGVWEIENGKLITNNEENNQLATTYWQVVTNTLPNDLIKNYVSSFRLFTDGLEEDLGAIIPMNDFNSKWQVELDITDMDINSMDSTHILNYTHTLIHEYGHLLTLNATQVTPTKDEYQDDKKGYLTMEGYAKKKSYLGQFVQQFWPPRLLHKWDKIDKKWNQRRRLRLLYRFYLKRQNSFVTDYAAESPEEDIAEAWTFFILSDKPKNQSLKEKKILFFYQFPDLVAQRKLIRGNLQSIPLNYLENFNSSIDY